MGDLYPRVKMNVSDWDASMHQRFQDGQFHESLIASVIDVGEDSILVSEKKTMQRLREVSPEVAVGTHVPSCTR